MALKQPDILKHNNPNLALIDSDFTKGGFRTEVDDKINLYDLISKIDEPSADGQLKEHSTIVYVKNEKKYYVLVDISNIDNENGWDLFLNEGGGIAGVVYANNGLSTTGLSGDTVILGGELTGNTNIDLSGNSFNLIDNDTLFTISEKNILLKGNLQTKIDIDGDLNNLSFDTNNDKLNIGDTTIFTSADGSGIKYADNYHDSYNNRSLVDKEYVDIIATGLHPKSSAFVATTGDTTLSGHTNIDGVITTDDMRVLVKDQIDKVENGLYLAKSGEWIRTPDFDGTPTGETQQGNIIPVISGDTNLNSIWILLTSNPIIVDETELEFGLFSRLLNVSGGYGINVDIVNGHPVVSIDLSNDNSGLEINVNDKLQIADISGSGTTWQNGQLNANVSDNIIAGVQIPVKLNSGGDLAIDSDDINYNLNITGASNGLGINNAKEVVLGGQITGDTSISGSGMYSLSFTQISDIWLSAVNSTKLSTYDSVIGTDLIVSSNEIRISSSDYILGDYNQSFKGIVYNDNYHDKYTSRSLPDVDYVTGITQSIINNTFTGVTNLGTGTTISEVSGRTVGIKSISTKGDLFISGDSENIEIVGNYHYKTVNDLTDRDAIPENERVDGMLVYVVEEGVEYRLESDLVTWTINDISYNKETTTGETTYYISSGGSDITGDGSELNPWKTINYCLSTIPTNLVHRTKIQLGSGVFNWTPKDNFLIQKFIVDEQLRIYGEVELIRDDFTTDGGVVNPNNPFEKTVVGATWGEDEYFGKLLGNTNLDNLHTCSKHSSNSVSAPRIKENVVDTHLYNKKTTLNITDGTMFNALSGGKAVQFRNIDFITSESTLDLFAGNTFFRIMGSEFLMNTTEIRVYGYLEILDSLIINNNADYGLIIRSTDLCSFRNSQLVNIGSNYGSAIYARNRKLSFFNSEIVNYETGFYISGDGELSPSWGDIFTRAFVFTDVNKLFSLFSNNYSLSWFNHEIYLNNVNYAIDLNNLSYNNINIDFRNKITNGNFLIDYFNGTPPAKLVDPSKNFSIQYDGADGLLLEFTGLTDTPDTYEDGKWLKVSGDSIVYTDAPALEGISGVTNIGSGEGEVFSGVSTNDNIQLRTIKGSGDTTVTTSGDTVIIYSDIPTGSTSSGIPIEDLGTKDSDFTIDLSSSKLYKGNLENTGSTINIGFVDLLSGESTVNVITFTAINEVTLGWNSNVMWHMGNELNTIPAGYTYRFNVSTQGNTQSDIFIQYSRYLTST